MALATSCGGAQEPVPGDAWTGPLEGPFVRVCTAVSEAYVINGDGTFEWSFSHRSLSRAGRVHRGRDRVVLEPDPSDTDEEPVTLLVRTFEGRRLLLPAHLGPSFEEDPAWAATFAFVRPVDREHIACEPLPRSDESAVESEQTSATTPDGSLEAPAETDTTATGDEPIGPEAAACRQPRPSHCVLGETSYGDDPARVAALASTPIAPSLAADARLTNCS